MQDQFELFFCNGLLLRGGNPQQLIDSFCGSTQDEYKRLGDLAEELDEAAETAGVFFRIGQSYGFGNQFTNHNRQVRDESHGQYHGQFVRVGLQPGNVVEQFGYLIGNRDPAESTGNDSDQSNPDLYRGKVFFSVFQLFDNQFGRFVALGLHVFQAASARRNQGDFVHGEKAVHQ